MVAFLEKPDNQVFMRMPFRSQLENFGVNVSFKKESSLGLTPKKEVLELLLRLRPKFNGHSLIRVGPNGDGGYLIPNDLRGVTANFSPGCDLLVGFERDLYEKYEINSFICDSEEKKPPSHEKFIHFTPVWIAPSTTAPNFLSLRDWISNLNQGGSEKLLQMDIEGAEYLSILALNSELLNEFRIIVIEIHYLEMVKNYLMFNNVIKPFFDHLLESFDVVHLHPNNCCGNFAYADFVFPRIMEVTFHRKDRRQESLVNAVTPNSLDFNCVKGNPKLRIDWLHLENIMRSFT